MRVGGVRIITEAMEFLEKKKFIEQALFCLISLTGTANND